MSRALRTVTVHPLASRTIATTSGRSVQHIFEERCVASATGHFVRESLLREVSHKSSTWLAVKNDNLTRAGKQVATVNATDGCLAALPDAPVASGFRLERSRSAMSFILLSTYALNITLTMTASI
jgi:hypothetical protein